MALPDFAHDLLFRGNLDGDLFVYVGGRLLGVLRGFEGKLYVELNPKVVAKINCHSRSEG